MRLGYREAHLVVDEWDPEDIGEEEDDFVLGILACGRADVALDTTDLRDLAWMYGSQIGQ